MRNGDGRTLEFATGTFILGEGWGGSWLGLDVSDSQGELIEPGGTKVPWTTSYTQDAGSYPLDPAVVSWTTLSYPNEFYDEYPIYLSASGL